MDTHQDIGQWELQDFRANHQLHVGDWEIHVVTIEKADFFRCL